jgi:hypothetical protein
VLTGSISRRVYDVPPDAATTAAVGGPAVSVATTTPGQNAAVTFAATAGQRVSILLNNRSFSADVAYTWKNPDGSTLTSGTWSSANSSFFFNPRTIATTGTYTLVLDQDLSATGSITARLYDVPPDPTTTPPPGGPAVAVATGTPGQNASVTFTATAGQVVTIAVSAATFGVSTTYTVNRPDGTSLSSKTSSAASTSFTSLTLPSAGTYTFVVDPSGAATGTATVTLTG